MSNTLPNCFNPGNPFCVGFPTDAEITRVIGSAQKRIPFSISDWARTYTLGIRMDQEYDVFEQFPDGTAVWRGYARGLDEARNKLSELSQRSANEFFIFHAPTNQTIARANSQK